MKKLNDLAKARDLLNIPCASWMPPRWLNTPPIEYIEHNLKVMTEHSPPLNVNFRLNQSQRVYYGHKEAIAVPRGSGKHIIVLKGRRMGVTTLEQALSYAMIKTRPGSKVVTIAQTDDAVSEIFTMVKHFHNEDKNWIKATTNSTTALSYASLRSQFTVNTAGGTAIKRGATLHRAHGSEVAFWDLNDSASMNLIASVTNACNLGEIVLESTANGSSGVFYELWQDAIRGKGSFHPIFLPWFLDHRNKIVPTMREVAEIFDTLDEDEIFLVTKHDCSVEQLAWRRMKIAGSEKGLMIFKQEFPSFSEEAFLSTGYHYYDSKMIEVLIRLAADPIYDSNGLTVWKDPQVGHRYIVAADTSEGNVGSDPTPVVVLDWRTGEQVYRLNCCLKPNVLGERIVEIAKKYNDAIIAVESNNTGHSVLNTIMNTCLYPNIYYMVDDVRAEEKELTRPGWRTDGKSKPILLAELNEALEKRHMTCNDKLFLEECRTFNGEGKVTKKGKHHGDLVIAWGIAWQVRKAWDQLSSFENDGSSFFI